MYGGTTTTLGASANLIDAGGLFTIGEPVDIQGFTINVERPNDGTTGTIANGLATLSAAGNAVVVPHTNTTQFLGVVTGGAGTTGTARIALGGQPVLAFDGATVSGDLVQASPTNDGLGHDSGSAVCPGNAAPVVGKVLSTNGGAGTYKIQMGSFGCFAPSVGSATNGQLLVNTAGNITGLSVGSEFTAAGTLHIATGGVSSSMLATGSAAANIGPAGVSSTMLAGGAAAANVGTLSGVLGGTLPSPTMAAGAAATNVGTLGGVLGGSLPNPTMAVGAASTNVGTLGGTLSGTLPNPSLAAGAASTNIGTLSGVLTGTLPSPGMAVGAAAANVGTLGGSLGGTLPNPILSGTVNNVIPKGTGAGLASSSLTDAGAGVTIGAPVGGAAGIGTLNAAGLYVNGVPVGSGSGNVNVAGSTTANNIATWTSTINQLSNTGLAVGSNFTTAGGTLQLGVGAAASNLGYTPVPPTRNVFTSSPITGGGPLSADLSLALTGPSNLTSFTANALPKGAGAGPFVPSSVTDAGAGVTVGAPTGGALGAGTINAAGIFVNGSAVGTGSGNVTATGMTSNAIPLATSPTAISNSEISDTIGGGVLVGSPTGGQKGAGTLNAAGLYINGVAVSSPVLPTIANQHVIGNATGATAQATDTTLAAGTGIGITASANTITITNTGPGGLSGMTAGQVPIANSATTANSSKALTGTGAKIASAVTAGATSNCANWTAAGDVGDAGQPCGSATLPNIASGHVIGNGTIATATAADTALAAGAGTSITATGGTITVGSTVGINDQHSAGYTVIPNDAGKAIEIGGFIYTLPQAGSAGFGSGWGACFVNIATTGNATISASPSIFNGAGGATTLVLSPGDWACPASDGTNYVTTAGHYASGATTVTANPGLASLPGTYNSGTQTFTNASTLSTQIFYTAASSAGTQIIAATDGGRLWTATVTGVTFQLPNPGTVGTGGFQTGFDGSHAYSVTTVGGTAQLYGCGPAGTTVAGLTQGYQFVTDGTNWQCLGTSTAALINTGTHTVTLGEWNLGTEYICNTAGCILTLPAASSLPAAVGGIIIQTIGVTATITATGTDVINNGQIGGGSAGGSVIIPADITTVVTTSGTAGATAFSVPLGPVQYAPFTYLAGQNLAAATTGFRIVRFSTPRIIYAIRCEADALVGGTATLDFYSQTASGAINAGPLHLTSSTFNANAGLLTEVSVPLSASPTLVPANYWVGAWAQGSGWTTSAGSGACQVTFR